MRETIFATTDVYPNKCQKRKKRNFEISIAEEGTNRGLDIYGEICARGIPNY